VGEVAARAALQRFLRRGVGDYEHLRDRLDHQGTSRLSTHLRFGTISALEVSGLAEDRGGESFVRQLVWRDFFHQLVAADPSLTQRDLRPERSGPIATDPDALEDWCQGRTGVPLVDAGMRQLLQEGWMPNRARLVVASYLTRVLGISWRLGAAHFDRHLTDGDPSSNAGNWQWVAGTGASSRRGVALNIDRQAARFDPDGTYRAAGADPPEGPAS
jgi:deoxyribodipyrimidine photo-lyase